MRDNAKDTVYEIIKALLAIPLAYTVSALFFFCVGDDRTEPVAVEQVLLVYLAGDNNLSGESHDKLEAIRRGYSAKPCSRLLVYHDAKDRAPYLAEITSDNSLKTIEQYETENSADAAVFHRVVTQSKTLYPGAVFNLLAFSHASGWLPDGSLAAPKSGQQAKSILTDGNRSMELADFAAAIPDNAFDHIVFEACFMAGVEVAYQLKDKANYIAASSAEIVSPGFTPVYAQHINELVYGPPQTFIQEAFNYFDSQSGYMRSATVSLIKTAGLDPLAAFIGNNCDLAKEVQASSIQHFDRGTAYLFCDFEDYYARLLETSEQKRQLQLLIQDCVIWKAATPYFMQGYNGFAIEKHSGLTGYIPQDRYPLLNASYVALPWYKAIRRE